MGLFDKKFCSVCGEKIGLLGNRKLEDGNLCKNCAAKLSPWFSDRRSSTVEEIKAQLAYREANREKVASFITTQVLGKGTRVLLDENNGTFMVTSASNLADANPDVIAVSDVTGCSMDVDETKTEIKRKNADGQEVSYNPPRYSYDYDFYITINVNNPYFNEIRFRLNDSTIENKNGPEYSSAEAMGNEIKDALLQIRSDYRQSAAEAARPKQAVTCPHCGATTIPTENGTCEYCGAALN